MARTIERKRGVATSTGAALAAVMLGSPGLAAPAPVERAGQVPSGDNAGGVAGDAKSAGKWTKPPMKLGAELKHKGEYAIAGLGDGHVVFEDPAGKLFYVDPATGDQKFVTRKIFSKVEFDRGARTDHHWIKLTNKVTILGLDESGKLVMLNQKGERFTLDATTGDMIFLK